MCVGYSMCSGFIVSLRRVLTPDFQVFSGMFPWGFENVLGYQEELGMRF